MQTESWQNLDLEEGVIREPVLNHAHLALWLKGAQGDGTKTGNASGPCR